MSAKFCKSIALALLSATFIPAVASAPLLTERFGDSAKELKTIGRGDSRIADGVLTSSKSYVLFGTADMKNYRMKFRARAPKYADQVQIWAGFNAYNRYDRYVLGIKGGLQDDIVLNRMGFMGTDEFLDLRELGFHPEPGEWINVAIEVCEGRIRVFLNNEDKPRIDVVDKNFNLAPQGYVTLGGGWIPTEFDDLVVESLPADYMKGKSNEVYEFGLTAAQKEEKRKAERAAYEAKKLDNSAAARTELSLDGEWLFMPSYEMNDQAQAISVDADDSKWHVMDVPAFWNPSRIWLHGESMGTPAGHRSKGVSDTYYQSETRRCMNYTFDYRKVDAAWYRQWIELPEDIKGKHLTLDFDAVSKVCEVYVNGQEVAKHVGMFGDFSVDASNALHPGKNLVVVKVLRNAGTSGETGNDALDIYYSSSRDNSVRTEKGANVKRDILKELPHGFYGDNPAGIWQPVKLTVTEPVKVEDVFIRPSLTGAAFELELTNHSAKKKNITINTVIKDHKTGDILYQGQNAKVKLAANVADTLYFDVNGLTPKLWAPSTPNLYDFEFSVVENGKKTLDKKVITSGFRTFEVKNGQFYLNNQLYALRGANHTPFALGTNDRKLANNFYQIMKEGNLEVTRTHTCPYTEVWMSAADENGVGISYEGTWSWLYIHDTMPADDIVDLWEAEWLHLMKKMRNHPSLLFWTVNNEMKFYDLDPDFERTKYKFTRISNAVKHMRQVDPTRPVCFDSNYQAKGKDKKFGADFMATIDDGDIDDVHSYINWYDHSLFKYFKGELQNSFKLADRPLISQEMSTGYPNNETGHSTRSYMMQHQNPQSLIGLDCYEYSDPAKFLKVQSFITSELAEALRRSNDQYSGTIHFALLTWFREVYNADRIKPWPTYYAMQRAMQPVLVSAELWGRHLYAGEKLPVRFYIVNDDLEGKAVPAGKINWSIVALDGTTLAKGSQATAKVDHYGRTYVEPNIVIPSEIPGNRADVLFKIELVAGGKVVSHNQYELTLADKTWAAESFNAPKNLVVLEGSNELSNALDYLNVKYNKAATLAEALKVKDASIVLSSVEGLADKEIASLRTYIEKGGKVLILKGEKDVKRIFPEYINDILTPTEGDIANMDVPESPVFNGLDYFDLRYFNNNKREMPKVCDKIYKINRNDEFITPLVMQQKIHGYVDGDMLTRSKYVSTIRGFAMLDVKLGNGSAILSTMSTDKAATDPVAGRLLLNMINQIGK